MISADYIDDFQIASNIEAGNHTYLHELWHKQNFKQFEITIGSQDLNSEFVTSEFAGTFLNSSFGIPSLISDNIPVPIFPLTALGISGQFKLSESLLFRTAIFDDRPETFKQHKYNAGWDLNSNDGYQIFSELEINTSVNHYPGTYKIVAYYHNRLREYDETKTMSMVFSNNYGFYFLADQSVWKKDEESIIGLFAQVALSPGQINLHDYYFGGGLNYKGIVFDDDLLGLAFAHAGFSQQELKDETTIEMFYKTNITDFLYLQPDVQYIINPAGVEYNLENAVVVFIRFAINF